MATRRSRGRPIILWPYNRPILMYPRRIRLIHSLTTYTNRRSTTPDRSLPSNRNCDLKRNRQRHQRWLIRSHHSQRNLIIYHRIRKNRQRPTRRRQLGPRHPRRPVCLQKWTCRSRRHPRINCNHNTKVQHNQRYHHNCVRWRISIRPSRIKKATTN